MNNRIEIYFLGENCLIFVKEDKHSCMSVFYMCSDIFTGGGWMKVFKDLKWFFKQEKRPYIAGILLLILVALLELVPPKIIGVIV
mgnify:CR=1 FL=1